MDRIDEGSVGGGGRCYSALLIILSCVIFSAVGSLSAGRQEESSYASGLRMNSHYIAGPAAGVDRGKWLGKLLEYRRQIRGGRPGLDRRLYDRSDLKWMTNAFTCHFTFMYDRSFYDCETGKYTLDAFLDDGEREFGGYDAILLWQAYPRLGIDERNQFDFYRDMPGGLAGIRDLVRRAHERGVRVFIDYNPWDRGTRRESKSDEDALAELVAAIEVDGIFLDTMSAGSSLLREKIDKAWRGVAFVPEGHPEVSQLDVCSGSWAQGLKDPYPPGLLRLKWIEPRHMQYQIRRWERGHRQEIESAFFNGSGMMIWENIFGTYNPWGIEDRRCWRRAVAILRHFCANFSGEAWDPFYPTPAEGLFAHRWPGRDATVFTLLNHGEALKNETLLEVPAVGDLVYYDLWNGRKLHIERPGQRVRLIGSINRLGCILAVKGDCVDRSLRDLLNRQREEAERSIPDRDVRKFAQSVVEPEPVERTRALRHDRKVQGMVFVDGGTVRMRIQHRSRECGCYPDPGTPKEKWPDFLFGWVMKGVHDYEVKVRAFFIDEAEVSNAEFKRFIDGTGYQPRHPENFLKHWPDGKMPPGLGEHPVVYVDIDDARAYSKWAGKRLPTEAEWHFAAQGTDGRTWPWGNEFDAEKCNTTGEGTMPVRSCSGGRSPYGCYHMAGNVWEWTESCRDDGHTRFVIIRGGSYFNAKGSKWYVEGGPKPCNHHAKLIRMWPGLDRCATIGFRCVVDANLKSEP
jgi:formylglycine-generating enzyme required for sulfatase activity